MQRVEASTGQPIRLYLMDAYLVRGLPTTAISAETGVDASTIVRWLARFGIPARKRNYAGRARRAA
jgi:transposase